MNTEIEAKALPVLVALNKEGALVAPSGGPALGDIETREWRAWSDGSSLNNPGHAGWAVLVRRPDGSAFTLHGNSGTETRTNNEAELHALLQALKAIPEDRPAVVYSDSNYSINAATTWRPGWERKAMRTAAGGPVGNADRIRKLWAALDARPLARLEWVRGHAQDEGNHTVDGLARRAAEAGKAGRTINCRRQELPAP